ncbi:MAG: carbohydrate kinase, partial [Chloroflexi bacterium]|nr:carbohydrate kinase [Chloroflexota bacterium]
WLANTFKLSALKDVDPLVEPLKPDQHGLTILPFISGERSLGWHAEARMTVSGISQHTSPAEVLRAGMESLAYQINAVYEQLRATLKIENSVPHLICSGGALLGSAMLQSIIADTLGATLYLSHEREASARGAALLALEALGVIPDVAQIAPPLDEPVKPNAERGEVYRNAAARQQKLYQRLLGD